MPKKKLIELYREGKSYVDMAAMLGRSVKSIDSELYRLRAAKIVSKRPRKVLPWHHCLRKGFLDIETSNLEADAGFMLSWAIALYDSGKVLKDHITQEEILDGTFDRRICASLRKAIDEQVDIVITYNGTLFDVPFVRTRFMGHKIRFWPYGEKYHWDIYFAVRSLMRLHRNSLLSAAQFLRVTQKSALDMFVWFRARVGHRPSLAYVVKHNIADVLALRDIYDELTSFRKWQRRSL